MKPIKLLAVNLLLLMTVFVSAQKPVEVKVFKKNFPTYNIGPEQEMPYLKKLGLKKEFNLLTENISKQLENGENTAESIYLKSLLAALNGDHANADELKHRAEEMDKDVIYKTRVNSSYIKQNLK